MDRKDFAATILVDATPHKAFEAITNMRGWWSEAIEGNTEKLNEEFSYHYKDIHSCKMRLVEVVPDKKLVWLVTENHFNFTKDQSEWIGTKVMFDIAEKDKQTQIHFTHEGLIPQHECYNICHDAWSGYIKNSLRDLITTGKGRPNTKKDSAVS